MKKLTALLLAIVLVLSMSAVAFADNGDTSGDSSTDTSVTFSKPDPNAGTDPDPGTDPGTDPEPEQYSNTYTVAIPRTVELDENCTGTMSISLEAFDFAERSKRLNITIDGPDYDGDLFFIYKDKGGDNEARIPIDINNEDYSKAYGKGALVACFDYLGQRPTTLHLGTSESFYQNAAYGDYSGTLRFNIDLVDRTI